jgi:acetyltransferase-like isoleucine patch superfamily enzyme
MENAVQLAEILRELYESTDDRLRSRFRRSLSFQDGAFDRWERAKRLGFGEGASIYNSALVFGDVSVGRQTWIGPCTILDGSAAPLVVGDYCSISAGVHLYTHDTVHWALSGGIARKRSGPVTIADCVYIGPQSIVTLGVTIGRQCIVGANSFVNSPVETRTFVAGNPARPVGRIVGDGSTVAVELGKA